MDIRRIAGAAGLVWLGGCCTPPVSSSLTVALNPQQTSMWCWAASGQMTMGYLGTVVSQCDEANKEFGSTDCCNNPKPGACVQGGWPEYGKYGFNAATTSDAALSWDDVKRQIYCRRTPFAFTWHWTGGGGHMMVATGYTTVRGTNYVAINNPWPPNVGDASIITYDVYVSGADHTHWNDYYNIQKQ
ncbi:papain like cysteine protease AvrRpt2 [Paraburkholderia sp. BL6669N2]|uniref:papain-like cysteine protease family protein n=1 Tax=Paraburkholderia sp. BL6669N2 TaxID=1938807 RepID=UPI000E3A9261|nr:papain-like cysteine protease family protein [Paraburkholderia sp. BL6669N2]REG48611.1 papain like cysteine protease AvrRpt2 [Paraburkholderia sp. BL6669N2]